MAATFKLSCSILAKAHSTLSDNRRIPTFKLSFSILAKAHSTLSGNRRIPTFKLSCSILAKAHSTLSHNRPIPTNNPSYSVSFPYPDIFFSGVIGGNGNSRGGDWSRGDENEESKPSNSLFSSSNSAGLFGTKSKIKHSVGAPFSGMGGFGKKPTPPNVTLQTTQMSSKTLKKIWNLWPKTWTEVPHKFKNKGKPSRIEAILKSKQKYRVMAAARNR